MLRDRHTLSTLSREALRGQRWYQVNERNGAEQIREYRGFLRDEENAVLLYRQLAGVEKNEHLAQIYASLASTEEKHAEEWRRRLADAGAPPPSHRPDLKTRILMFLARRLGPEAVLPSVIAAEKDGSAGYRGVAGAETMSKQEQSHGRVLRAMHKSGTGGMEGSRIARMEGRHRGAGGNALRAAVLGANDGLVSNLSLIMGVAGAGLNNRAIAITGFAGLLAGAISMALGEWLSVQSSRELYQRQIETESAEIESSPEEEAMELSLIYQSRGIPADEADRLAGRILSDPTGAVETLVREELGIDPEVLGGSAWEAAFSSFFMFAIGAIIPILGFLFRTGTVAIALSAACALVGLFLIGAVTSLSTNKSLFFSGMRMAVFGIAAAAVTFGIGKLFNVAVSG